MKKFLTKLVFGIIPTAFIVHTSVLAILDGGTPPIITWLTGNLSHWGPRAKPLVDQASTATGRAVDGAGNALSTADPAHISFGRMGPVLFVVLGVVAVLMIQQVSTKGKGPAKGKGGRR